MGCVSEYLHRFVIHKLFRSNVILILVHITPVIVRQWLFSESDCFATIVIVLELFSVF